MAEWWRRRTAYTGPLYIKSKQATIANFSFNSNNVFLLLFCVLYFPSWPMYMLYELLIIRFTKMLWIESMSLRKRKLKWFGWMKGKATQYSINMSYLLIFVCAPLNTFNSCFRVPLFRLCSSCIWSYIVVFLLFDILSVDVLSIVCIVWYSSACLPFLL